MSDACEWTVWPSDPLRYSWKNGLKKKKKTEEKANFKNWPNAI